MLQKGHVGLRKDSEEPWCSTCRKIGHSSNICPTYDKSDVPQNFDKSLQNQEKHQPIKSMQQGDEKQKEVTGKEIEITPQDLCDFNGQ